MTWNGPSPVSLRGAVTTGDIIEVAICVRDLNGDPVCASKFIGIGTFADCQRPSDWRCVTCLAVAVLGLVCRVVGTCADDTKPVAGTVHGMLVFNSRLSDVNANHPITKNGSINEVVYQVICWWLRR